MIFIPYHLELVGVFCYIYFMKFIGITGGVGAGKSTVLTLLKENYNCIVVLADEVAAELMNPGHDCYERVIRLPWDRQILNSDGTIDRAAMAASMYADEDLREYVNSIVHPAVEFEVLNRVERARKEHNIEYFFLEAALLIECGYGRLVDEMWYIFATEDIRRNRLRESRGYSDGRIDAMLKSQKSDQEFRANCQIIIDNSGTTEETLAQIQNILGLGFFNKNRECVDEQ